ncbi:MAG: leucyl aminopeptidase [Pirellulaceae bacterium]
MQIQAIQQSISELEVDAAVVGIYEGGVLPEVAQQLDQVTGGGLQALLEANEVEGKLGDTAVWLSPPSVATTHLLIVGLGPQEEVSPPTAFRAAAIAAKQLAGKSRARVAFCLDASWSAAVVESAVCGSLVGCVGQDLYRNEKNLHPPEEVLWHTEETVAVEQGQVIAESVNLTRRLVNEPADVIYPETFAEIATQEASDSGFEIEVWDEDRLREEKCGSLLGVARGSDRPARLLVMRHRGSESKHPELALVGKGVTFDSGGLSLKPSEGMKAMKCDMAGAATVLGTMRGIARLQMPHHVLGVVGLVENMVSGNSYKLGDVLQARNGKTIEVLNTDAEGRLVLADALDVARDDEPAKMINLATLTGACVVALGTDVVGLMTNDQAWCDRIAETAASCGERAWQLPMFPEFAEQILSKVADIKNIGEGRWGGAITAGKFLEEFVGDTTWTHMDIAGPAFQENEKPEMDAGGSGVMVRTLLELVRTGC